MKEMDRYIEPVGDVKNCLFYGIGVGFGVPDATKFGPASGLALCPVDQLSRMAARHVSLGAFVRAKVRFWFTRLPL